MDFNQLNVFIHVYDEKNFSAAAKALFLTQPTVSAHIRQLEKELNVRLFERTTKRVKPTEAGERLYAHAVTLCKKRQTVLDEFMDRYGPSEMLQIGASTLPGNYILPRLIHDFSLCNRRIRFHLITADSEDVLAEIRNGRINIGFVGTQPVGDDLEARPFFTDNLVFVTANKEKYRRMFRDEQAVQRLLREPIIVRLAGTRAEKRSARFLNECGYGIDDLNVVARINDPEKLKRAVMNDEGISLMSRVAARDFQDSGHILVYNPVSAPLRRSLYLVRAAGRKLRAAEERFIRFVYDNV